MERSAQQRKFDEERVRALLELDAAKARAAMLGRAGGAGLITIGAALAYANYEGIAHRHIYVPELLFFAAWASCAGLLLLVAGAGGAARIRDVPVGMWAAFAIASALGGLLTFVPLGRILASLAGFEDL